MYRGISSNNQYFRIQMSAPIYSVAISLYKCLQRLYILNQMYFFVKYTPVVLLSWCVFIAFFMQVDCHLAVSQMFFRSAMYTHSIPFQKAQLQSMKESQCDIIFLHFSFSWSTTWMSSAVIQYLSLKPVCSRGCFSSSFFFSPLVSTL